ncbi:MAG: PKD domain-containing protein, partial [bacterium]|nr:PKD domain-containing protein [bacterium]
MLSAVLAITVAQLAGCSTSFNPLPEAPDVQIVESERTALTAGALPAAGITLSDGVSGAAVSIPGGTVITLDASSADDIPAVIPDSIVVSLRPISQFLANQNGDFLDNDGLNIDNIHKVGALAVLPVIGRANANFTLTIPVNSTATGNLSVWRFIPDDNANVDGTLTALPTIGHWRIVDSPVTANAGRVEISTSDFGQYIVTSATGTTDPTNDPPVAALTADPLSGAAPLTVTFNAGASTDSDGTIIRYEWDFEGDGSFGDPTTVPTTTHIY